MKPANRSFFFTLLGIMGGLFGLYAGLLELYPGIYFRGYLLVFIMITATTLIGHSLLVRFSSSSFRNFMNAFMAALMGRFFIYLIFILVYLFKQKEHALPFTICFLTLYLVTMTTEIIFLLKHFRHESDLQKGRK